MATKNSVLYFASGIDLVVRDGRLLCSEPAIEPMPSPPVQIFLTTIASQPALRQRQGETISAVSILDLEII